MKCILRWNEGLDPLIDPPRGRPRKVTASDHRAKFKQITRRRKRKGYR